MNSLINVLIKLGVLKKDLDYHLARTAMVIIFLFFGYQKWFDYEVQGLIPYIGHGPLIFWMYHVFGVRGATWFLGVSEWLFCALLFAGFWNKKIGILGALGSCRPLSQSWTEPRPRSESIQTVAKQLVKFFEIIRRLELEMKRRQAILGPRGFPVNRITGEGHSNFTKTEAGRESRTWNDVGGDTAFRHQDGASRLRGWNFSGK